MQITRRCVPVCCVTDWWGHHHQCFQPQQNAQLVISRHTGELQLSTGLMAILSSQFEEYLSNYMTALIMYLAIKLISVKGLNSISCLWEVPVNHIQLDKTVLY